MGGVVWTWRSIALRKIEFLNTLDGEGERLRAQPIRIILRPTRSYVRALESGDFSDFAPSERNQLERGDVPYFFSTLECPRLFFYDDASLVKSTETDLPPEFSQSSEPLVLAPLALTERWEENRLAEGLLTLAWKLCDLSQAFRAESYSIELAYRDGRLFLKGAMGAYSTPVLNQKSATRH